MRSALLSMMDFLWQKFKEYPFLILKKGEIDRIMNWNWTSPMDFAHKMVRVDKSGTLEEVHAEVKWGLMHTINHTLTISCHTKM